MQGRWTRSLDLQRENDSMRFVVRQTLMDGVLRVRPRPLCCLNIAFSALSHQQRRPVAAVMSLVAYPR